MSIQESGEMYLETILVLTGERPHVRAVDVAEHMGYSKPSVSRAMGLLKREGLVTVETDGSLQLTPAGREIAEKIYERHTLLTHLLMQMGVDPKTAAEDACKIEHHISDTSFNAIRNHTQKHKKEKTK